MQRIGVTDWYLDDEGQGCIPVAAALGFGAIQIGINRDGDHEKLSSAQWRRGLLDASRKHDVTIAGLALNLLEVWGTGESPADGSRRRASRLVWAAVQAAREMEASLVYIPAFGRNEIGPGSLEKAAAFLRGACEIAACEAITIASENTLGLPDNLRLIHMVGHPAFRILIDTYNPQLWGHRTADLILGLQPYLCDQAHVKDGLDGVMGSAPLGSGEGKVEETLDAFSAIRFPGMIFLENDYRGGNRKWAASDIDFICKQLSIRGICASRNIHLEKPLPRPDIDFGRHLWT